MKDRNGSKYANFFKGMGSVLSIYPTPDLDQIIKIKKGRERMYSHWERVGKSLRNAMECVADETKR